MRLQEVIILYSYENSKKMMKTKNSDKNKKNMLEPILTVKLKKKIKNDNMKTNWTKNKLNSGRVIPKSIYI